MQNKTVAIVFGAVALDAPHDEADVLVEVKTVSNALKNLGYRVEEVPVTLDLLSLKQILQKIKPYLVYNLVESIGGKGRYIHFVPAVLEEMHLPYTGALCDAVLFTSNKLTAKQIMRAS